MWPGYDDAAALCAKLTANIRGGPGLSADIKDVEVCAGLPIPATGDIARSGIHGAVGDPIALSGRTKHPARG